MTPSIRVGLGVWVADTVPQTVPAGEFGVAYVMGGRITGWTCSAGPDLDVAADGSVWVLKNLGGWFGGLDVRVAQVDVMQGDGALSGPVRLAARTVTVEGSVLATSRTLILAAMDQLDALLTGATRTSLFIVDEIDRGIRRQAQVHLAGPTMCKRTGPLSADFSVSLLAPDPTRYPVPE